MNNKQIERAIKLQNDGEWEQALNVLLAEHRQNPRNTIVLYSLAVSLFNLKKLEEAHKYINKTLALNDQFAPSYVLRAYINFEKNQKKHSLDDLQAALKLDPLNDEAIKLKMRIETEDGEHISKKIQTMLIKGIEYQNKGMQIEAQIEFDKVLELDGANYFALYSLGVLRNDIGDSTGALVYLKRATKSKENNGQAFFAMATVYMQLKLYDLAIEAFDEAIKCDPMGAEAYNNKAVLLHEMHKHQEALATLDKGLEHFPNDLKTLGNKGYLLTEFKRHNEASEIFKKILTIEPDREYVLGLYAYSLLHACNWTDFHENISEISTKIEKGIKTINPLAYMAFSDDGRLHKKCAEQFGADKFRKSDMQLSDGVVYVHQKKRIGFVSSDFREHPVGYLFIGLLELLDKNNIETYGFSLCHNDGSDLYKRYKYTFDNYLTCENKTSAEIAGIIKQEEIDVLVDLSGYTSGSRLDLFAMKPAPVQVTYLGFPGTLGLPYFDYLIADSETAPLKSEQNFTENILRLSSSYLPRDLRVLPSNDYPNKSEFELPVDSFVFCSFNHEYKITPPIFKIWMELLLEIPDSVLWLMRLTQESKTNLSQSALSYGVDPKRIIFAKRVPRIEDHLARYRHVDLCLDTFPYNGHTTTSDALFMGVPVVTLAGESFASRVATGLLRDVGLKQQLSCESYEEYKKCAKSLATQPEKMTLVRGVLNQADIKFWEKKATIQAAEFSKFLTNI